MNKLKVCWITLCKNEEDIIPFCIQYWKRITDKVVVFDNFSTDKSIELLSQHDWIEIRYFESDGQNDVIQKTLKEQAYLQYKNDYDIIIISDMDEVFYFDDFKASVEEMINGGYSCMMTSIFSLCEDSKPIYEEGKYLHQLCHKFYLQKMNHMPYFDKFSKISIFNTKLVDSINMSVGQHYVYTNPKDKMQVLHSLGGFCIHIDKGFGIDYKFKVRQKMNDNLSETNKKSGMCIEYADSFEKLKQQYMVNQYFSFDINELMKKG